MKPLYLLFTLLYFFNAAGQTPEPGRLPEPNPVVNTGFGFARVGDNGWFTSEWTLYSVSPVLVNDQLLQPGKRLTIAEEGEHLIAYASPDRQNHATQIVRIDRTPPQVSWNTPLNFMVSATHSGLSVHIADSVSGICLVEISKDNGRSWQEGWNAAGFNLRTALHETTWTYHDGFPDLAPGGHVMIVRARDCAGNRSPGVIQVIRVSAKR